MLTQLSVLLILAMSTPRPLTISELLMESTFKIVGTTGKTGTVFLLGRPCQKNKDIAHYVLVTANHVLMDCPGESAQLHLREKLQDGSYKKVLFNLKIRDKEKELWSRSTTAADTAAMMVSIPTKVTIPLVTTDLLADDALLLKYEVRPGDQLFCLGFPFSIEANAAGFPVLRSGRLASYPVLPTDRYPTFLFDFNVFGGNSGGPVFLWDKNRVYGGAMHVGTTQFLVGVVNESQNVQHRSTGPFENRETTYPLALAVVTQAPHIRSLVLSLPEPD